jgi:tRNA threonylcarbamoyladenosine biosynthesis protein TsaB
MNCLAIETATEQCSVALGVGDEQWVRKLSSPRESSREIYGAIAAMLEDASITISALDCVAFGCGPGSFTGLRVAAGVAQGLAYAQNLPVCRISTLAALALTAAQTGQARHIAACLDARMGEVYLGLYAITATGQIRELAPDQLLAPAQVTLPVVPGGWVTVGSGWSAWPELETRLKPQVSESLFEGWPDAGAVLTLARHEYSQGNTVGPAAAIPNYLRNRVTD